MNIKFKVISVRKYETSEGERLELQMNTVSGEQNVYPLINGYLTFTLSGEEDIAKYENSFGQFIEFTELEQVM